MTICGATERSYDTLKHVEDLPNFVFHNEIERPKLGTVFQFRYIWINYPG